MEHLRCPPAPAPRSPPWPGTIGMGWTTADPQPILPSPLQGQNPLLSHPAGHEVGRDTAPSATGFRHWESPGHSWHYQPRQKHHKKLLTKAGLTPSCRTGSELLCQHRREASSRWAHVLLKRKRSFLHQMEHFLLNNPPILICAKKIAPCVSPSCICRSPLPALNTRAEPRLPDRHVPCPRQNGQEKDRLLGRAGDARRLGAGVFSISAEPLSFVISKNNIPKSVPPPDCRAAGAGLWVSMVMPFRKDGTGDRCFLNLGDGTWRRHPERGQHQPRCWRRDLGPSPLIPLRLGQRHPK